MGLCAWGQKYLGQTENRFLGAFLCFFSAQGNVDFALLFSSKIARAGYLDGGCLALLRRNFVGILQGIDDPERNVDLGFITFLINFCCAAWSYIRPQVGRARALHRGEKSFLPDGTRVAKLFSNTCT